MEVRSIEDLVKGARDGSPMANWGIG